MKSKDKFLILGQDSFIDEHLKKIDKSHEGKDVDRRVFFGDEFDSENFLDFICTAPLFSDIKFSIIKNASKIKTFPSLLNYIKNADSFIAVCDNDGNFLSKQTNGDFFQVLSEGKKSVSSFYSEIREHFKPFGIVLSTESCKDIYELCLNDMKIVKNECEKLSLYYKYKKPENEMEIIDKLSFSGSESVFNFIDSLFNKNKKKCFEMLSLYMSNNENLNSIFYMLSKRLSQMILYKINRSLLSGEKEFIVRKIADGAGRFKLEDLSRIMDKVIEIDYGSKTGRGEIKDGIFQIINSI